MQRVWYSFLRIYVRIGLHFFFRRIDIQGVENIPSGPVIFTANHQNAFMDALLIVCFNSHLTHFLARADIFQKPLHRWLLASLNMIPIYRIRDGWQSLSENGKTFEACNNLLSKNQAVVIFPEGNHGPLRRIRPISKGFAKVAFEAAQKYPNLKINIVPVGLNYTNHRAFRGSVRVIFDKPILANDYYTDSVPAGINQLRDELAVRMRQLTTHVEDEGQYASIIQKLEISHPDYLDPIECNRRIAEIEKGNPVLHDVPFEPAPSFAARLMGYFVWIINFPPLFIWNRIQKRIKDPVFIASMKFTAGIFLFPFYYFLVSIPVYFYLGLPGLVFWLFLSTISMIFYK